MTFLELSKQRYALRKYSEQPVEREKIDLILEAASLAPTGANNQPQRIMVADDPAVLAKIRLCTPCQFNAPVTLVICYDKESCWYNMEGEPIGAVDASIVTAHMQLEAVELGLGTCWVACFNREKLQQELSIPENYVPVALLPLGYPAPDATPARQHTLHRPAPQFTTWNKF